MDGLKLGELDAQESLDEHNPAEEHGCEQEQHHQQQGGDGDYDDYVMIRPAKIWTRPDIEQFKTEVSAGDGDGVITIGHGDTVTVGYACYHLAPGLSNEITPRLAGSRPHQYEREVHFLGVRHRQL